MTHKDIYIKFMIEYDKANVTSSYPSLTEYEVATVLDKAYNALIAQKVTGNNVRRAPFEADVKAIADLQMLVHTSNLPLEYRSSDNTAITDVPNGEDDNSAMLYFVSAKMIPGTMNYDSTEVPQQVQPGHETASIYDSFPSAQDAITKRPIPVRLVNHDIAENFMVSYSNMPWVKTPVCYIENDTITVVYDPLNKPKCDQLQLTYIKKPNRFAKDLSSFEGTTSYFMGAGGNVQFELNETMAEELISLAISFALENVESPRLNTKLNMRGLES